MGKKPKGNCKHCVSVQTQDYDTKGEHRCPEKRDLYTHPPVVWVVNDNDGYYGECFHTRLKINKFIEKLIAARDEAWPKPLVCEDHPDRPATHTLCGGVAYVCTKCAKKLMKKHPISKLPSQFAQGFSVGPTSP